ncbi:F-box protein [Dorcoceras hygrometricum]|uniref:F-box protein n=1 Tax=Dorcoceras hygrometricum TaxID=472368 RepID=A0A2Z7AB55_9LAMI|nr:F-box protein [Dorcoceras hygrometricum]
MLMENEVEPPADHKLAGFLRVVLAVPHAAVPVPLHSLCCIAGERQDIRFVTQNNVALTPIVKPGTSMTPSSKKRRSIVGMVHGSISVLHQLHTLVLHKCLRIVARVVETRERQSEIGGGGRETRAVVLVDVYFPAVLWCGWQFPRFGSVAAALCKHLSCDWDARSLLLSPVKVDHDNYCGIWSVKDCHVLHCIWHCSAPDNSKKKLFELQEIFKSLPCVSEKVDLINSRVQPAHLSSESGIWVLSDDILMNVLSALCPKDLLRISLVCRHLRFIAGTIMPCMKLKLYPHQQAAVNWMLSRERESKVLQHPLFMDFKTEDGFDFYINKVSGEIVSGVVPTIKDFHGGMFCDEPGLGKTITSLSLILKSQGTLAEPPNGVQVIWSIHDGDRKCGYYEVSGDNKIHGRSQDTNKKVGQKSRRGQLSLSELTPGNKYSFHAPDSPCSFGFAEQILDSSDSSVSKQDKLSLSACSTPTFLVRTAGSSSNVKRQLLYAYDPPITSERKKAKKCPKNRNQDFKRVGFPCQRDKKTVTENIECRETWIQCDSCGKWRKLENGILTNASRAWFCSMNDDPYHQDCNVPEESWDYEEPVTYLLGFHTKGTCGGQEENIAFFISVLKEHYTLINTETKKALTWLAKLSPDKLAEMETMGVVSPVVGNSLFDTRVTRDYHKIFQAFGLTKKVVKNVLRWFYPGMLVNLSFDLDSLRIALCEPLHSLRLYLSSATLIVVPSNLVNHWKTQIDRHVRPGQLRVYVWGDQKKKPPAHNLAWDYDIVISTFNNLSAEWSPHKRSVLMQVHWLRVMLDEGHTLGSSLNMTNKLQMAVSLTATNRWLLTGTPTPNTPSSQLSHLQPMLKFLREEAYGQQQKSWEAGILRPFEAEMEEGRSRLLQLLHRCMISARKVDLQAIPPCIRKVTFLDFSDEHAKSYNELVETVRRNILMADWNDPSHVESLLNQKQWKFRATTIQNVRLSCCVAGHVRVTDAGEDIQDTMDILVENGLDTMSQEYDLVKYNLLHGGNCMRCQEWCRLPVITPCRHFLCLDCVALDCERCTYPGCENSYEMQSPEVLARPENPNPKWPVPKDLIELQPSYKQDDWNPDWQSTTSSKVTYLVQKLQKLQEANRTIGYHSERREITSDSLDLSSRGSFLNPSSDQQTCCNSKIELNKIPLEKVLIFSQFLEHIHIIEQQLSIAGIQFAGMYSPMHSSNKMKSLATFQHDANCMALLMDGSAALGLDLSFVTHVYLMEPIWDRRLSVGLIEWVLCVLFMLRH